MVAGTPREDVKRLLILGGKGRLGAALARCWSRTHDVRSFSRPELDVNDLAALKRLLEREKYDVLINATGQTNVDRCEKDREEAHTVNVLAPRVMAEAAAARGKRAIHFSTDYVFDGEKSLPYVEEDQARPLGYYGRTKLDGEAAVLETSSQHVVVRVSWVFGPDKPSFVDMIVQRALSEDRVEAIADKFSCPTYTADVSRWLEPFLEAQVPGGLYHACNSGACSWQGYGQHALDCAARQGRPLKTRVVEPISLSDMKNFVAPRPRNTVMDISKLRRATGLSPRPWQEALAEYLSGQPG